MILSAICPRRPLGRTPVNPAMSRRAGLVVDMV